MEVFYFFIFSSKLRKVKEIFFSLFCHSLALGTGLEKTRTTLRDSV